MTIELVRPKPPRIEREVHPEWAAWIEASAYTHAVARQELGLANGTTAMVAKRNGRAYLGCELNPEYEPLIEERLK